MVLAERNSELVRNGRRSRGPSPNGHGVSTGSTAGGSSVPVTVAGTPDTSSDDDNCKTIKRNGKTKSKNEYEEKIRVGRDYQAVCPPLIPEHERKPECIVDRALLVWSPTKDIPDAKLEEYITVAQQKYGYNGEQALGMLFWHKHDLERAVMDLANFTPFPDEWTIEDKVLFEQAFQFHGKSFHRIRQMLPDKSIASLVKYYYSWKKTRHRQSVMDRQEKLKPNKESGGSSDNASDNGSNDESDNDDKETVTAISGAISTADQQQQSPAGLGGSSLGNINNFTAGVLGKDIVANAAASSSMPNCGSSTLTDGGNSSNIALLSSPTGATSSPGDLKHTTGGISMRQQRGSVGGQQQQLNTIEINNLMNNNLKATITSAAAAAATTTAEMANKGITASNNIKKNSSMSAKMENVDSVDGETGGNSGGSGNGAGKSCCDNCNVSCDVLKECPYGKLCTSCYHHWRRTGGKRPTTGPYLGKGSRERRKLKPPRGMYINYDDIATMAASNNNPDVLLASIEREIVTLKSQVQLNKQQISSLKQKNSEVNPEDLRPPDLNMRPTSRWTNEEMLLVAEGVRNYGKNFQKIADIIGTKTEAQLRTFYMSNRRRYNLDQALKKYELDKESNCGSSNEEDIITKIKRKVLKSETTTEASPSILSKLTTSIASKSTAEATNMYENTASRSSYAAAGAATTAATASNVNTSKLNLSPSTASATNLYSNLTEASGSESKSINLDDEYCQETTQHDSTSSLLENDVATSINATKSNESVNTLSKERLTKSEETAGVVSVTSEEDSSVEFSPINDNKKQLMDDVDDIDNADIQTQKMITKTFDITENNVSKELNNKVHEVLEADEEDDEDDDVMEVNLQTDRMTADDEQSTPQKVRMSLSCSSASSPSSSSSSSIGSSSSLSVIGSTTDVPQSSGVGSATTI